jgi:hypothetical protein
MKGSCLCSGVQYEVTAPASRFGYALTYDHCSRCRKTSGSAFMAEIFCKPSDFRWLSGEALVKTYEAPVRHLPPGYQRTFCSVCGCSVPHVRPDLVFIPAGSLDDDPGVRPDAHCFVGYKAPWFEITDQLPQFERNPPH